LIPVVDSDGIDKMVRRSRVVVVNREIGLVDWSLFGVEP